MGTAAVHQKKIGEVLYTFSTMPASKAHRVWSALQPNIKHGNEPSLAALSAVGMKEALAFIANKTASAAEKDALIARLSLIDALFALPDDDWVTPDGRRMMGQSTARRLVFEHVNVGTSAVDEDASFTGRLKEMGQVLEEALRFNFADFFSGMSEVTASLQGAAKAK